MRVDGKVIKSNELIQILSLLSSISAMHLVSLLPWKWSYGKVMFSVVTVKVFTRGYYHTRPTPAPCIPPPAPPSLPYHIGI